MGNSNSGTTDENSGEKPKKNGAFQLSQEPLGDPPLPDTGAHKFESAREGMPGYSSASTLAFEDLGELPQSYGDDTLFLIARDPHWMFSYWDVNWPAWQP